MTAPSPADIRARLVEALEADFVGPFDATGQEVLPLPPSRWYLTGFLAPQGGARPEPDDDEGELAAGEESQADDSGTADPEPKRRQLFPASLGLSVFLPPPPAGGTDSLQVTVRYADYEKVTIETGSAVAEDHESQVPSGWKRVPHRPDPVTVPLSQEVLEGPGVAVPRSRDLRLRGELRTTRVEGLPPESRILSLFLVNERKPLAQDRDRNFIFQVSLELHTEAGFLSRPNRYGEAAEEDDPRVLALQFRESREWAVGHNTSVLEPVADADGQVRTLGTTLLPRHEVRQVEHTAVPDCETGMQSLSRLDGPALARALTPLAEAYEAWVEEQIQIRLDRQELERTRTGLLQHARRARRRMEEGILLLEQDEEVRRAFNLANLAMHVAALQADGHPQRPHRRYRGDDLPQWRPFQLAFLLLNLASVADPHHDDRKVADLIYFPTGGGKTEAYLGLIAYTLVLRRLRGKERPDQGRGVAVVLRYTLRLLTLDQLARAATLICALEELRRRDPGLLGNSRFAVGLWVGARATANRLKDVQAALQDFSPGQEESPFPLTACPWCGEPLGIGHIKLVNDEGRPRKTAYTRAAVYCSGPRCVFTERQRPGQGLPVLFVDEQIYAEVPDFVVATVDKFAMMPWRGDAGMLFGRATHLDALRAYGVMGKPSKAAVALPQGLYPPELIVQDEMHLISGPLGTMVGLYETAIDCLCERSVDGVRRAPKVVCSTATVRRAREQIRALFDREMAVFPPRGVNHDDNFFATTKDDAPGRLYLGVAAPGRALRAVSVRTYSTLLAAAQNHFDPQGAPDQPADPYMTLVGYFNSLRELGGMRRLVEDEVRNRVAEFARGKRPHHYVGPHPWAADRRLLMPEELTSRESTERVKETKARLATSRAAPKTSATNPLDTVLASSMISVGLDIDRLGLMVVTGQPKTMSEYIQATSRVGRAHPGLVVTCLNAARPRDRSHYERFVATHQSFYRQVEATSVTPFSLQTLDRGMVGTLLSMIRHGIAEMQPPTGLMQLASCRSQAEELLEQFVERGRRHREWHDLEAETRMEDELRSRGRNFLDAWDRVVDRAVQGAAHRTYSNLDGLKHLGKAVMHTAIDEPPEDPDERRFVAPTSMRDVEPNTHIWLRFRPLDDHR